MAENNDKTVFVLDHTPYFGISAENYVDLGRNVNPISKSLWTSTVESSVEYCRIVWDLFPAGKLIRFVISDAAAHIVNNWATPTQNLSHVLNAMAMVGIPAAPNSTKSEYTIIHGLRAAVEAISEPTEFQKECLQLKNESIKIPNKGRVICITSARDNASMKTLEDIFLNFFIQQNTIAANDRDLLNIDNCHLVIINLYPTNLESLVTNREPRDLNPNLKSEIHSIKAANISIKLMNLILPHYNLASTTVTGIPMKEEQNSSSSANYDVEIVHEKRSHSVFIGSELVLPESRKEGYEYETVTLKWSTPRAGSSDLQPCMAQFRVTPVDVTSRPSSCLINFLLSGRSVLLEMPKKTGGKITSHLLSARGGEIFIHSLNPSRSCLEDFPSISEGIGGKHMNYRISDFVQLTQLQRLVPLKMKHPDESLLRMRSKIAKNTKYFPITLNSTLIFNIPNFVEPILVLTQKEELKEEDVLTCKQCVYQLVGIESRHESLALQNNQRVKGHKRDDQYRLMWNELEMIVSLNGKSVGHKQVISCIRECRARGGSDAEKIIDVDQPMRDFEIGESSRASVIKATTDSPMSPPPTDSTSLLRKGIKHKATISLFDIVMAKDRALQSKRADFSGRLATPIGQVAKLYPNLAVKETPATEVK